MAAGATGIINRDQAFCSKVLRYTANHGPDFWSEENIQNVVAQWQLSPEMEQHLRDMQHRIADIDHFKNDPQWLTRFMAAPWGYHQAETMFRKMIEWRKQNHVDTIFDDYVPPQLLLDCVPSAILKDYDREGDPIYCERGGSVDAVGLMKVISREEMIRYCIWTRERNSNGVWLNDYERRQGRHVRGITIVYDLKGLNSRHLNPKGIEYFKEIMKITQENFPSPIKRMFIIRAPRIFQVMWSIIKHFFPATARAKMTFLGSTGYLEVLDKYLDINVLPPSIYEKGSGDVAVGMMQSLDGVDSVQDYLDKAYGSKVSTAETDEESLSSDSFCGSGAAPVHGKLILRGRLRNSGTVEVARVMR
ncbi:SEC14-like protein 2 [Seminavis robusta]|uniref:SEC14-like protein 2 n=1 Tax=Seminavis robusta TaxID=568900 RepID=A0A9N8E6W0_9STRA|nr:SEC14-like protein 2 [Seminavis robusta]|eukprot:Sro686_g187050.1 SEC14-like protein 2 (361) ;mRNA; f:14325-15407